MDILTKSMGWILVLAGLALIFFAIWTSYEMVMGKAQLPEFFSIPKEEEKKSSSTEDQMQDLLQQTIKDQLKGTIPSDVVSKSLNLSVWAILAMILLSGGSRISDVGVKLIRSGSVKNDHVQG